MSVALFYHDRGRAYIQLRRYQQAIADFSQTLRLFSTHKRALYDRGTAYYLVGQYQRALADFTKALGPRNRTHYLKYYGYQKRGLMYLKTKQYRRAVAEFTTSLRINPRHPNTYYFRAEAYERLGNRTAAIKDYRAGQRLAPKDRDFAKALQRLRAANGRAARPVAGSSKKQKGSAIYTAFNKLLRGCKGGRGAAKVQACSRIIRFIVSSGNKYFRNFLGSAYLHRGWGYFTTRKYSNAISEFTVVIRNKKAPGFDKHYRYALLYRCRNYSLTNQYNKVLSDYSKILRNAKSVIYRNLRVKAYYRRGHVFLKIKQYRRAVAEFTTAIGINRRYGGRHADVNYFRAQAYERLGNRAAAIKDYCPQRHLLRQGLEAAGGGERPRWRW